MVFANLQLLSLLCSPFQRNRDSQNSTKFLDWRLKNKVKILEVSSFWLQWGQGRSVWYSAVLISHALARCWTGRWNYAAFRETVLLFSVFVYFLIATTWSVRWHHPVLQPCSCMESIQFGALLKRTSAVWVCWEKSSHKPKSILLAKWIWVKWKLILQLSQCVTAERGYPYSFSLFCEIFFLSPHVVVLPSCFSLCCSLILCITKCELNALAGFTLLPVEASWKGTKTGTGRSGGAREKVPLSFLWSGRFRLGRVHQVSGKYAEQKHSGNLN